MRTKEAVPGMVLLLSFWIGGCASMSQREDEAWIREPGNRTYNEASEPVSKSAQWLWEYAVLSENVYTDNHKEPDREQEKMRFQRSSLPEATQAEYERLCLPDLKEPLPLPKWKIWDDFPSEPLRREFREVGLYAEVWEKASSPPIVAVVFRGTEPTSWKDWWSNFRWFSLFRFIPGYKDQYTVVSRKVGEEFITRLAAKNPEISESGEKKIDIVSAGHSLGGGLAQHFAYSFPVKTRSDGSVLKVSEVYGFDPSPVTGWFSVDRQLRTNNARGLKIHRIFEHGEILAYIRLILRYVNPPTAENPSIQEIRYNFVQSANIFASHSMRLIACELIDASGQADLPGLSEKFGGK